MAKPHPSGAIPLIEAQWSHRAFVEAVQPDYALTKITSARQLEKTRSRVGRSQARFVPIKDGRIAGYECNYC